MNAAAVVDVGQVIADATDVREVDVLFDDTLAAADQRRPVLSPRYYTAHEHTQRRCRAHVSLMPAAHIS